MSARLDYAAGGEAGYTGADAFGTMLAGDVRDTMQMQPFSGGAASGVPWWQQIAQYGIVRAIDNRFGPVGVQGNTNPGNYAGQNGRTYTNTPTGAGGVPVAASGGFPTWAVVAAGAVIAFLALR